MASSLPDPTRAGLIGAVLSRRWRLVRKLGEGGMGEVYAADGIDGGARVAVKILRREFIGDTDVQARFLEEGRTCMRLTHPNIVRMLECAQAEDGSPYLVMELLDGVPLSAYMQNGARVPVPQAVRILAGILSALAAAHAQGVVHRDLKPDNVFLTRDPSGAFVLKVLDFGIAKVMDVAGGMGARTRTGMLLGTPAYMSPEQARNARDVDQRADLWSAGILFYEMLTGRVAFPAPTEYARLAALLSVDPEPVERCDASFMPLAGFMSRALKKNREERFATASEMSRALASAMPGVAPRSEPPEGDASRGVALSRLPDVASVLAPVGAGGGDRRPSTPPSAGPSALMPTEAAATRGAGGTLASPAVHAPVQDPAPAVMLAPAVRAELQGTMPSKDRRGQHASARDRRSGLSLPLVALLVVVALAAGFMLGWTVGRTM